MIKQMIKAHLQLFSKRKWTKEDIVAWLTNFYSRTVIMPDQGYSKHYSDRRGKRTKIITDEEKAAGTMIQAYMRIPPHLRTPKVLLMFIIFVELYAKYEDYARAHPSPTEDDLQRLANQQEYSGPQISDHWLSKISGGLRGSNDDN